MVKTALSAIFFVGSSKCYLWWENLPPQSLSPSDHPYGVQSAFLFFLMSKLWIPISWLPVIGKFWNLHILWGLLRPIYDIILKKIGLPFPRQIVFILNKKIERSRLNWNKKRKWGGRMAGNGYNVCRILSFITYIRLKSMEGVEHTLKPANLQKNCWFARRTAATRVALC